MGKIIKGVTRAIGLTEDPAKAAAAATRAGAVAGEGAARSIRKQPFDISRQAGRARKEAGRELEAGRERRAEALEASRRQRERLEAAAEGRGPSLAEAQLKSAQERTLAQQLAAAASRPGGSAAATQRALARSQAAAGRQLGQEAAQARIQEQLQARQQLGAQLAQERAASDTLVSRYLQLGFTVDQAEAQAQQDLERLRQAARAGSAAQAIQARTAAQQAETGVLGGLLGAGAQLGAAAISDKNQKKNIKDGDKEVKKFLEALSAKQFEHKDPKMEGAMEGEQIGIMAQDMEKSPMGKTLVIETPNGKMINTSQGFGAILAAQSHLNNRLDSIEKTMKKVKARKVKNG